MREQEEIVDPCKSRIQRGSGPAHDALACLPECSPSPSPSPSPSLLFYSAVEMESIPGKIWSKSAPDLAFSMRWDFFLSHHTPFLSSFAFHHISWNPFMCLFFIYTSSTTPTPTPFKRQAKPLMPSTQTYLPAFSLLYNSSSLQLLVASSSSSS